MFSARRSSKAPITWLKNNLLLHFKRRLVSKLARFVSDCLEHLAAAVYASQEPQTLTALERPLPGSAEILGINLFDHCAKSHRFDA